MKLAALDWTRILPELPRWDTLSPRARRAFLQITPGIAAAPGLLDGMEDELVAAGFISRPGPRGTNFPHAPELRDLLAALRAMHRLHPLHGPTGRLEERYLQDQFSLTEMGDLVRQHGFGGWYDRQTTASAVSSVAWVNEFLAAGTGSGALKWENARRPYAVKPHLTSAPLITALHTLVKRLSTLPAGVPLRTVGELLAKDTPQTRAAALAAGLRYELIFVSMHDEALEPTLGVLPAIARRLGPPSPPPAPVVATETWEDAFRVSDMTVMLVEAAAEPIPVRGTNGRMYVRSLRAMAPRLASVPRWAEDFLLGADEDEDEDTKESAEDAGRAEVRLGSAARMLQALGMASIAKAGDRYHFAPTAAGRKWLARPEHERIRQVVDVLRESRQLNPAASGQDSGTLDYFGIWFPFSVGETLDLRAPLAAAFLAVPAQGMMDLEEWALHQGEAANPLLALESQPRPRAYAYSYAPAPTTREGWEDAWAQVLTEFLRTRLAPLGGARLGQGPRGVAFALTPVGRYLLGATDKFQLAPQAEGDVVVKPDFEIVFLAAAPRLEAEFSRYAERLGSGVGALFRLTRASVLRGVEHGLGADRILKAMGAASRSPVPDNVARQVRDWCAATRRVRVGPAVLVECPDMQTAARVASLAGTRATAISRTVLRLDGDAKANAALLKKMRAQGIFPQD
ncbi:MAG TPA: helicase-associated domain-containing protein [Longimicrobium sp.]|jgi:hypothetical protein|uniref:helicase-associated domain-containing protein n=1 Tax=Longimicrobium sp. TaxID=2029185 RepID=UPI002EDB2411